MHRMTTHMTRFVVSPVCGALLSGAGVGVTAAVGSAVGAVVGSVVGAGVGSVVGAGEGSVEGTGVGSVLGEGSDSVAYARTNGIKKGRFQPYSVLKPSEEIVMNVKLRKKFPEHRPMFREFF